MLNRTKKDQMIDEIIQARAEGYEYFGTKVRMKGFPHPEVIINPSENFIAKLTWYQKQYDDDLIHSKSTDVSIESWAFGHSYGEIQNKLLSPMLH